MPKLIVQVVLQEMTTKFYRQLLMINLTPLPLSPRVCPATFPLIHMGSSCVFVRV